MVGCMTGTSIDGLDAAAVRIEGEGLGMRARFERAATRSLGALGARLRAVAEQAPTTAGEIAKLSREFSLLHVEVIDEVLGGDRADLVAVHGQTVFHEPPASWQLLTPAVIARGVGAPVVSDLRAADLAAGGQGAPITPLADWVCFRGLGEALAVVNLGGFCNVTMLPGSAAGELGGEAALGLIRGRDVCACNHILDTVARRVLGVPYDEGGGAAMGGEVDEEALDDLLGVLAAQRGAGRSLGTGDEVMSWVGRHRLRVSGGGLGATACEAIGQMVAGAVRGGEGEISRVLLAGGGVRNRALVGAIASCCSCRVETTDAQGVPSGYREAMCMGILGALCQDRVPITLSAVTGAAVPPAAGVWCYP